MASLTRLQDTLAFTGALERSTVPVLWPQALAVLDGVRRFELAAVTGVDSAGLALLAELAARVGEVVIDGTPPGLDELRGAYRLEHRLDFAA